MIDSSYFWIIVIFLAIGTLSIRFSIIGLSSRITISPRMKEVFSFIPASVLPALIAPMVFFHKGQSEWLMGKERLIVVLLAAVLCYYTRSMVVTIVFGLLALFVFTNL